MSNLLKEAIVDAKALREAALKNAESAVIDKYADEVRESLQQLLEQDEFADADLGLPPGAPPAIGDEDLEGLGVDTAPTDVAAGAPDESLEEDVEDVPYAATDDANKMNGKNLKNIPAEGERVEVTLDLGALRESVKALQAEIDEDLEFNEDELATMLEEEEELPPEEMMEEEENVEEAGTFIGPTDPEGTLSRRGRRTRQKDDDEEPSRQKDDDEEPSRRSKGSSSQQAGVSARPPRYGSWRWNQPGMTSEAIVAAVGKYGATTISENENEEIEISDELINDIVEKLTVDMSASLSGWAGRSSESMKWELQKALAQRRSTDIQDELDIMKKAQEELVFENKQLKERLSQYERVTSELKETLQNVNLSNARLLYTNRVLRNTSLNERQKTKIVEAISKSDSVTEAKTIYNTLQSTVVSTPPRGPKTLSEAISRPSSVIRATRKEKAHPTDVFAERMRRLAGIN